MEIIILVILGGFSWLANLGLNRLLERRLHAFQPERVYIIPGFFRQPLLLVALVLIPLEIIFPLAWLIRPEGGIGNGIGLVLPALMLPLLIFALVMLWIHYGAVVLTREGVRRYYFFGSREISFSDIRAVHQRLFFLTPVTRVEGCDEKIRFPRQIRDHPQLYLFLSDIQKANMKSMGLTQTSAGQRVDFPFSFGISSKRLMWEKIAFAILMLIFAVLATMGVWIQLAQEMLPPFTLESFFLIGLFFIPFGIIFPILLAIAYRQTFHPEKPTRFELYRDRIEVFYPRGRQESYKVSNLRSVRLNPIRSVLKGDFHGANVSDQVTHYEFQLHFFGGKTLSLTPNRLAMYKQTPEGLREIIRDMYGR